MATPFAALQTVRQTVAFAVAKAFGFTITLDHRGGGAATVYARFVTSGSEQRLEDQSIVEARYIDVVLPVQTGAADPGNTDDEAVIQGDLVVHRGRTYQVAGEIQRDDKDRSYHFRAYEHKTLSLGATAR